jgi:competence protein ComEC
VLQFACWASPMRIPSICFVLLCWLSPAQAAKPLDIYFIDVGPVDADSTLIVSPSGESMLIDTGFPWHIDRVVEMLAAAGVKRLDYLLITHYHSDHVSGLPQLAAKIPIGTFIDHGPSAENEKSDEWWHERRWRQFGKTPKQPEKQSADALYANYLKVRGTARHIVAKAGDKLPIHGVDMLVVTSAGKTLAAPLPGAGTANPACAQTETRPEDDGEDEMSIGLLVSYGGFRYFSLGDLAWGRIYSLFCPRNLIGPVDAWHITHHGTLFAKSPAYSEYFWRRSSCLTTEMLGLRPAVGILSAGTEAGLWGTNVALKEIRRNLPGMDLWETVSVAPGTNENRSDKTDYNSAEKFIVNPGTQNEKLGYIKMEVQSDGSFAVTNSRNGFTKRYPSRK